MTRPILRSASNAYMVGAAISLGMMVAAFAHGDYRSPWILMSLVCVGNAYYLRRKSREK